MAALSAAAVYLLEGLLLRSPSPHFFPPAADFVLATSSAARFLVGT